jgi:hypothetical protein
LVLGKVHIEEVKIYYFKVKVRQLKMLKMEILMKITIKVITMRSKLISHHKNTHPSQLEIIETLNVKLQKKEMLHQLFK